MLGKVQTEPREVADLLDDERIAGERLQILAKYGST